MMRRLREVDRRQFLSIGTACGVGLGRLVASGADAKQWLELRGRTASIAIGDDLSLEVRRRSGQLVWQTSKRLKPEAICVPPGGGAKNGRKLLFEEATSRKPEPFSQARYKGFRIRLGFSPSSDAEIELVLALDAEAGELLIEAAQIGGKDRVRQLNHLYRIEKPTSDGGYLLVPHGSGYLIPAGEQRRLVSGDSANPEQAALEKDIVGARYTLPFFGIVKSSGSLHEIVDTYWDCSVATEHIPGECSSFDMFWLPSLGELRYRRRFRIRFADNLDYIGMAKAYRRQVQADGNFLTLADKAKANQAVHRYVRGIEYRVLWQEDLQEKALRDVRHFHEAGLQVNFFFPKWSSLGYSSRDSGPWNPDGAWQSYLQPEPLPGGWKTVRDFAGRLKAERCLIKIMVNPSAQFEGGPAYDASRMMLDEAGKPRKWPGLSPYYGPEVMSRVLDNLQRHGVRFDALYLDGYAAYHSLQEDFAPGHRLSRREATEKAVECCRLIRQRGLMPGAEMPRFWAVSHCDFFFFRSGWSRDLLPVGEPVPLFQLVFHECFAACFSGGGYGTYDWPEGQNPRLYELLFGAAPAYNWMLPYSDIHPGRGFLEVPVKSWSEPGAQRRLEWLKRWSSFYRKIAYSEMVSHEFLEADKTLQRVVFSNGASADFDMAKGLLKVKGVEGFKGEWEPPHSGSL